jgi:prefoldin subunit 5
MIKLFIILLFFIFIFIFLFGSTYLLEEARAEIRASLLDSIETREFLMNKVVELEHSKQIVIQKLAELDQYSSNSASTLSKQAVHQIFGQISYEQAALFAGCGLFLFLIFNFGYVTLVTEAILRALPKYFDSLATFNQNLSETSISATREMLVDVLDALTKNILELNNKLDIIIREIAELENRLNAIEILLQSPEMTATFKAAIALLSNIK